MKYYDGFGKDVSEYVYELERKAAGFDAAKIVFVEPKIEVAQVEETVEVKPVKKKRVRRTKQVAQS
jgi:hypothetical protein